MAQRLFNFYQQQPTGGAIPRPSSVVTTRTSQVQELSTSYEYASSSNQSRTLSLILHSVDSGSSGNLASMIRQEVSSTIAALFQQQQIPQQPTSAMLPIASPQQPHISRTMLAIPSAILERIRRGEFVNFDSLLSFNVLSESRIRINYTYTTIQCR